MDNLIAEALDLHVLDLEEERLPDGKWHPSQMFQCARMNVLAVRGVPVSSPPDAQAKRIFRIGNLYHRLVQDALPGHPRIVAVYPEFGIDVPEWNVVGHGDALIEVGHDDGEGEGYLESDGYWVVEIKSTKSLKYTPKEDHLKQASVYFTAARDFGWREDDIHVVDPPLGDKLKGILLAYLNKTDLEIRQYEYKFDPKWRPAIEKRVYELDYFRLEETEDLPPPLPLEKGKPNWFTRYCQYRGSGLCCGDTQEDDEW